MKYVKLGNTGLSISAVILGCGNFGGIGSAPEFFGKGESEAQAHELMDAAWEQGITVFDTADAYGGGASERFIGSWLQLKGARVRDQLLWVRAMLPIWNVSGFRPRGASPVSIKSQPVDNSDHRTSYQRRRTAAARGSPRREKVTSATELMRTESAR